MTKHFDVIIVGLGPVGTLLTFLAAKRFGDPKEFGSTCAFLCSIHAGYISGQNIQLDGGSYEGLM